MKITCSKGTGMQFENAVRQVLDDVNSCDSMPGDQPIEASVDTPEDIDSLAQQILQVVGSNAGCAPALSINLGDSSFAWVYEDSDGEFGLVGDDGDPLAHGADDIINFIADSWGKNLGKNVDNPFWSDEVFDDVYEDVNDDINSSTNTSNIAAAPVLSSDVYEDVYEDVNGVMGPVGDTYTESDMQDYWDMNFESDPVLLEYSSFEEWFAATTAHMHLL